MPSWTASIVQPAPPFEAVFFIILILSERVARTGRRAGGADVLLFGMSAPCASRGAPTCRQKPSARMRHPTSASFPEDHGAAEQPNVARPSWPCARAGRPCHEICAAREDFGG